MKEWRCRTCEFSNAGLARKTASLLLLCAVLLCLTVSCAPQSVYNISLLYLPSDPPSRHAAPDGTVLTVAFLEDQRKLDDRIVLGRVIEVDGRRAPVLPRHTEPSQAVVQALSAYLVQSGYAVSPQHPRWDLREESIDGSWGRILLGGTINKLFIECDRSKPLRTYSSRVNITLVLADVEKKQVLHRVTVETAPTRQHLRFSEIRMEEELSNALSGALERAFAESELVDRINRLASP